jgi:hypothetical protein
MFPCKLCEFLPGETEFAPMTTPIDKNKNAGDKFDQKYQESCLIFHADGSLRHCSEMMSSVLIAVALTDTVNPKNIELLSTMTMVGGNDNLLFNGLPPKNGRKPTLS